jgi:hypothetical protein
VAVSSVSSAVANKVGTSIDGDYGKVGFRPGPAEAFAFGVATGTSSALVRLALGGKMDANAVLADVFGNALGNSIVASSKNASVPTTSARASDTSTTGGGNSSVLAGAVAASDTPLSNNPDGAIYQPAGTLSPDEMAAAASGAEAIPEVLVTTDEWSFGEELEFWRLMMPRSQSRVDGRSGGGMAGLSMDAVAERARWNVQHDARLDYQNAAQLNAQGQDLRMLWLLSPINQFGLGESILTAASGFGSTVVAGFADLVTGDPGFGQYLQEEWTYQPRTEIGRDVLSTFSAAASPIVSGLEYSRGGLGDLGYSLTGSPTVAAALYTAPDTALTLLAPEARLAFGSVGGGLFDGGRAVARYFGESLFDGPRPGSLASQRGVLRLGVFQMDAVSPLDVGAYGTLSSRSVGDSLSLDHIPSFGAIRASVEQQLGRPLTTAEARELRNNTTTLAIDTDIHQQASRTYGGRNSPQQISADAADLGAAAARDQAALRESLLKRGYSPRQIDEAFKRLDQANREKGLY